MKTANKIISILTLFLIMIVSSCDMLQSTLSSEMNKELTAQTGSGSVVEKTFYYNGSKAADLLTTGDFKIDFGKKVVISKDGLVGKFLVTYTDEKSNISTVELKLGSNNEISLDCTELYLDMKPVLEYLKEKDVDNATVEISVSGLVCNEGEQKGRNISAFKETIKVQPLFSKMSDISVSTKNAPVGFTFEIPLNGKVVLAEDASLTVTGYDLKIAGVGTDGKSIVVKTNEDLTAKEFSSGITVTGITPISSGNGYSVDLGLVFNSSVISSDTLGEEALPNYALSNLQVKKDGDNLVITLNASSNIVSYAKNNITILIDNASCNSGDVVTKTPYWPEIAGAWPLEVGLANSVAVETGTSVEVEIATYLGEGNLVHYMSYYSNDITTQFELFEDVTTDGTNKVASTLTQNSSWYYDYGTSSLVYTIPLEKIGNAKVGDSIRVFVARSVGDDLPNSIAECCPTSAIKLSDGSNIVSSWDAQSVKIDMSKALEYVIE